MLKPAQLYKEKLEEEKIKTWYKPEYMYYSDGAGDDNVKLLEDNYNSHCFVSVDENDNIIGYISYSIDWTAMSVSNIGIISFQ